MIRHRITDVRLKELIEAEKSGWLNDARKRTKYLLARGSYTKEKLDGPSHPSWSEIKSVWRILQGHTCAYCQKAMASTSGAVEADVEHYRPKSRTLKWQGPAGLPNPTPRGRAEGYYWLALNHWNYCVSCKVCNSTYKRDKFPVAGQAAVPPASIGRRSMRALVGDAQTVEAPLLLFPIGTLDSDPEQIIGWEGLVARPLAAPGTAVHARALATISFFRLNDRDDLRRARAGLIDRIWSWQQDGLTTSIEEMLAHSQTEMKACGRAFFRRLQTDVVAAQRMVADARRILVGLT